MTGIYPIGPADQAKVLALNNQFSVETSLLEAPKLAAMVKEAFLATRIGDVDAFLIVFDQHARYDSPNFVWFRDRFADFVYVDRIVTGPQARGKGYARALYGDLFTKAVAAGHRRVVCEVNLDPPNPVSDAFHATLGFAEVGHQALQGTSKTVRYLSKNIPS